VTILQIGCAKVIWFLKHYMQIMLHDKYAHVKFDAREDDGIPSIRVEARTLEEIMDIQTVDQQYNQLQQEAQQVIQGIQTLAQKLKAASDNGDPNAREYLLDLRELAINIQQEQQQVMNVLQAVHQAMQSQSQTGWQPGYPQMPQTSYGQPQPQQGSGFLSEFLNSGFGRAIEMGVGFGIGDDLINSIF